MESEFNKELQYQTIWNYCVVKFKSKINVARKSHVKKDEEAVDVFKKTLVNSLMKMV
jgi:hypothetical protein